MLYPVIAPSRFRDAFEWTVATFDRDATFDDASIQAPVGSTCRQMKWLTPLPS